MQQESWIVGDFQKTMQEPDTGGVPIEVIEPAIIAFYCGSNEDLPSKPLQLLKKVQIEFVRTPHVQPRDDHEQARFSFIPGVFWVHSITREVGICVPFALDIPGSGDRPHLALQPGAVIEEPPAKMTFAGGS